MPKNEKKPRTYLTREVPGLACFFLALVTFLALVSFDPLDPSFFSLSTARPVQQTANYIGLAGAYFSSLLLAAIGLAGFFLVFVFSMLGVYCLKGYGVNAPRLMGLVLLIISTSAGLSLLGSDFKFFERIPFNGGLLGQALASVLDHFLNRVGAWLLLLALTLIALNLSAGFSIIRVAKDLFGLAVSMKDRYQDSRLKAKERAARAKRFQGLLEYQKEKPVPVIEEAPRLVKPEPPPLKQEVFDFVIPEGQYRLPSLDLLDDSQKGQGGMSEESLVASSRLLENKLSDFGVEGKVVAVTSGPVITMFEYEPAPGIKISRVANLADDLAMSMRAVSIRIVAPLPGKAVIGIEIPNPRREYVVLKDVISSRVFQESKAPLTLVMGVDIMGQPMVADLGKMPHLLIAGATGSGKSVGLNAMIISLLFKAQPDQVRFLMIDPKRIELSSYNDLPQLIYPVISDPKVANQALRWAVAEMERRYRLLAEKSTRNIEAYNRKLKKEALPSEKRPADAEAGETLDLEPLPYLVIIIDELADLMMVSAREVEESITRLAQMARAAGIHLILATQRPSVDVLTGIIKANLPTRISFQVTSKTDSRTILDVNGAEALLGDGDMLFLPPGTAKLTRIHGAFVSDDEVRRITDYIKAQQRPDYLENLIIESDEFDGFDDDSAYDEKYDDAVELVTKAGRASISLIQRHLRVGYNRAARMIELMERDGVVGPADGAKPRKIIAKSYE